MLRMIGSNSGDFVCTQVLHNLWKLFLCKKFILKEMKNGKSLEGAFKNEKLFTFDMKYESGLDLNISSEKGEVKVEKSIKQPKTSKILSTNYSKKKKLFTKLFSNTGNTHSYNKPIRNISSLTGHNENLKDSEIGRFQSIKRVPLAKKIKTNFPI